MQTAQGAIARSDVREQDRSGEVFWSLCPSMAGLRTALVSALPGWSDRAETGAGIRLGSGCCT